MKSKQAFFRNGSNISFPNSKIQFNSINVDEDIFDVYILYNNKKLQNLNSSNPNYYRIYAKDIGVTDDFKELNFMVVNNIELKINIKIKNKYDMTQKSSFKDRLKFFNTKVEDSKRSEEEFYQKYKKWDDPKYKESINKKLDSNKKLDQAKKEEQPKKVEQPKQIEQNKKKWSNQKKLNNLRKWSNLKRLKIPINQKR